MRLLQVSIQLNLPLNRRASFEDVALSRASAANDLHGSEDSQQQLDQLGTCHRWQLLEFVAFASAVPNVTAIQIGDEESQASASVRRIESKTASVRT